MSKIGIKTKHYHWQNRKTCKSLQTTSGQNLEAATTILTYCHRTNFRASDTSNIN